MTPQEPAAEFEALRKEIEHTRAELGDTVEALAERSDVKTRAGRAASAAVSQVRASAHDAANSAGRMAGQAMSQARTTGREVAGGAARTGRMVARRRGIRVAAALAVLAVVVTRVRAMRARAKQARETRARR